MKRLTMTLAFAAIFIISAHGQGFLNLNFESAQNLPGNPGPDGALVSITDALPDWTAYSGPNILSDIYYVSNSLGRAQDVELEGGSLAVSGNFSVGLYNGGSISQTGLVPEDAESLQFEAFVPLAAGFSVTLDGQKLSYSVLSESSGYDVYGADIPADLDGQTEASTFGCQGVGSGGVLLDNIEFSSMSVPEPSQFALVGLVALLLGLRHLRREIIES